MSDKCVDKHPAEKKVNELNQCNKGTLPRCHFGSGAGKGAEALSPLFEG